MEGARVVLVVKSRRPGQCSFSLKLSADDDRILQEWEASQAVKVGINYIYHHVPPGMIQDASSLQITQEHCSMELAGDDTGIVHHFSAVRPTQWEQKE